MAEATPNGNTAVAHPTCMVSVNRISKLPVVESTIQTATSFYEKVKDYNSVTNWTMSTAEGAVQKAVEVSKPITTPLIQNLEGPIKKVDGVLCGGLDYVETKVPAVKMPPNEIYTSTKDYVNNTVTPAVESARAYAEPAVQTARDYVEPAMKTAKDFVQPAVDKALHVMEPTIEMAKHYVEPLMQPAMETVNNIKDNVMHKVDEFFHREHNHQGEEIECEDCQKIREQAERQKQEKEQNEKQQQEKEQREKQQHEKEQREKQQQEQQQQIEPRESQDSQQQQDQ